MRTNAPGTVPTARRSSRMVLISSARKVRRIGVKLVCDRCYKHIEYVARSVDGVKNVKWRGKSNQLIVTFDPNKTSIDSVELAISNAGHDTANYKRKVEFYTDAPKCCKYLRTLTNTGELSV